MNDKTLDLCQRSIRKEIAKTESLIVRLVAEGHRRNEQVMQDAYRRMENLRDALDEIMAEIFDRKVS